MKREHWRTKGKRTYKSTLAVSESLSTVKSREVITSSKGETSTRIISPRKGKKWTDKKKWIHQPEDRLDYGLVDSPFDFDKALHAKVYDDVNDGSNEWEDIPSQPGGSAKGKTVEGKPNKGKTLRSVSERYTFSNAC